MQQHIYSSSEVIRKIRQINSLTPTSKEKPNISEQEWNNFLNILEETYKFVSRLKHSYPKLTDIDIRICALLKEQMPTSHISTVMNMILTYKRIHFLFGILIFCIAATVYCLTIEPTASFWDCPEFIVSAYKLEVGDSPGAPFFMLTANLFTQLTSDPALAAKMINYMSAITSACTILLLYLSITRLTRKLISGKREPQRISTIMLIISSGMVGSLASWGYHFMSMEVRAYL